MLNKELAQLLGVSESMVSRLAKRGMPIDSLERAQRWRKRHLEPGRVKGSRYDSTAQQAPAATGAKVRDLPSCIEQLNKALQAGPVQPGAPLIVTTRNALRLRVDWRQDVHTLKMPVRVWVRLLEAVCSIDLVARAATLEQATNVTAVQLADSLHEGHPPEWAAGTLLEAVWDLHDHDGSALQSYND